MDIVQDAMALGQDIEINQEQLNDIINQNVDEMNDGLEDEFAALDEEDMLDVLDDYKDDLQDVQKTKKKEKKDDYNSMMNDLLN